jgi:hypothetical protein
MISALLIRRIYSFVRRNHAVRIMKMPANERWWCREGITGRDEVGLEKTLGWVPVPGPTCLRDADAPAILNEGSNKY